MCSGYTLPPFQAPKSNFMRQVGIMLLEIFVHFWCNTQWRSCYYKYTGWMRFGPGFQANGLLPCGTPPFPATRLCSASAEAVSQRCRPIWSALIWCDPFLSPRILACLFFVAFSATRLDVRHFRWISPQIFGTDCRAAQSVWTISTSVRC